MLVDTCLIRKYRVTALVHVTFPTAEIPANLKSMMKATKPDTVAKAMELKG